MIFSCFKCLYTKINYRKCLGMKLKITNDVLIAIVHINYLKPLQVNHNVSAVKKTSLRLICWIFFWTHLRCIFWETKRCWTLLSCTWCPWCFQWATDIRLLRRHVLVPGSLDDSCLQGCKAAEWLKPACFIQTVNLNVCLNYVNTTHRTCRGCHLCQEMFNYRERCMKWLDCWQIALLCILPSDVFHFRGCKNWNDAFVQISCRPVKHWTVCCHAFILWHF